MLIVFCDTPFTTVDALVIATCGCCLPPPAPIGDNPYIDLVLSASSRCSDSFSRARKPVSARLW